MTDTASPPAPDSPTLTLLKGLMPSLNQAIVLIVTAVLSIASTLATQHAFGARPPVEKIVIPAADPVTKPAGATELEAVRTELGELTRIAEEIRDRMPAKPAPRIRPLK